MDNIKIWGIKFNPMRVDDFINVIEQRIKLKSYPIHISGVNPETVVQA